MEIGSVTAVVGGQYGSEGKGVIVAHMADRYGMHVRTGGPNAGHTFMYRGEKVVMQTIPCGWVNRNAILVIGAGGMIDPALFAKEIEVISKFDPYIWDRLVVDPACGLMTAQQMLEEGGVGGEMHHRIGSTGKGVGSNRRDRLMRDPSAFLRVGDAPEHEILPGFPLGNITKPTVRLFDDYLKSGGNILLEGTQGSGLSLIHGPWPYVTSGDTNAGQLCADAGISPLRLRKVMVVARTYPIRVAGNSGPMHNETTWEAISQRVGRPVTEQTTVTKKTRRISEWDEPLVKMAAILNTPTHMAITFADYLSPEDEGKVVWDDLSDRTRAFCEYVERMCDTRVALIGTGGDSFAVVDRNMDW